MHCSCANLALSIATFSGGYEPDLLSAWCIQTSILQINSQHVDVMESCSPKRMLSLDTTLEYNAGIVGIQSVPDASMTEEDTIIKTIVIHLL